VPLLRALDLRPDNEYALEVLGDILWDESRDRTDYSVALEESREVYNRALAGRSQLEHSRVRVAEINVALAGITKDPALMASTIDYSRAMTLDFPDRARPYFALGNAIEKAVSSSLWTGDPVPLLEESIGAFRQASALESPNVATLRVWKAAVNALAALQDEKREHYLAEAARIEGVIAELTGALRTPLST
jgi:hypothetical protein